MAVISHRRRAWFELPDHPELRRLAAPTYQAYRILHVGFFLLPVIAGIDKFTMLLANWTQYLAAVFPHLLGISPHTFMLGVGVIEIVAALIVLFAPEVGAWIVMAWLWGIIVNLLLLHGWYDVALRDFGLSLGAMALGRLAWSFRHGARLAEPPAATTA